MKRSEIDKIIKHLLEIGFFKCACISEIYEIEIKGHATFDYFSVKIKDCKIYTSVDDKGGKEHNIKEELNLESILNRLSEFINPIKERIL